MNQDLTVIYRGWRLQEVYLLRNLLIEQGFPAIVLNENVQPLWGAVPMTPETGPQIAVPSEYAEEARVLAQRFDAAQRLLPRTEVLSPVGNANSELDAEPLSAWPICPSCGAARPAKCPVCGEIAEDFRLADAAPRPTGLPPDLPGERASGVESPTHVCGICDEPMTPLFARRCPDCGHDFGDGADFQSEPAPDYETRPFNYRVLIVFLAVVAMIGGMSYYVNQLMPKRKTPDNTPAGVKELLDQALAAHGGEERFTAIKAVEVSYEGQGRYSYYTTLEGQFKVRKWFQFPDHIKYVAEVEDQQGNHREEYVSTPTRAWIKADGVVREVPIADKLKYEYPRIIFQLLLYYLPYAQRGAVLPSEIVDGRNANVVRFVGQNHERRLFFDAETHRLVKLIDWIVNPETKEPQIIVTQPGEYREIGGVFLPYQMDLWKDGKADTSSTVISLKIIDGIDESLFSKPEPD